MKATGETFKVYEVSADKACLSLENLETVAAIGGPEFVQFKVNSTGAKGGLFEEMFYFFKFRQKEFMDDYHKWIISKAPSSRSNGSSGFRCGARGGVAKVKEVFCKFLCHNICCLIQE